MFEALSMVARKKMSRIMKSKSKSIARKREIAMNKKATPEKLKIRAYKKARDILTQKILKDRKKEDLPMSGKMELEKKLDKKQAIIKKIAKRILPQIKKAESDRFKMHHQSNKGEQE